MKKSLVKVVFIALRYYLSGYLSYSCLTRSTHFSTRSTRLSTCSTRLSLVVLACPFVVLVCPFVCLLSAFVFSLAVPVCPPVILVWPFVCPFVVLVVLSVVLFITDPCKYLISDSLCFLKFQIDKDYIISLILHMITSIVDLSITIYTCSLSFFMLINKNLKETAFNYCAQESSVDDHEIDCSIISISAVLHHIMISTRRNGFHKKKCTGGVDKSQDRNIRSRTNKYTSMYA